jgi:hexosaminidase
MDPASTIYLVDPLENETAGLTGEEKSRVLGGEVCMWTEYVSIENVDSRIWPRTAAVAERLWSPEETKDIASMYRRLDAVSRKLDWLGLTHLSSYLPMLRRMAGDQPIDQLKVLADVVQPANQDRATKPTTIKQPRSIAWWTPRARKARPPAISPRWWRKWIVQIRAWLILWRDNDAKLGDLLEKSFLLKEDIPASKDLSRLAAIGLEALDGHTSDQSAFLAQAKKLPREVELAERPLPWNKLIQNSLT